MNVAGHVALTLFAVIVTGRVLGFLLKRLGQPPVIGEILAGICLGPSLLGWLFPKTTSFLISSNEVATAVHTIAQVGVVLCMFLVGIELDLQTLRGRAKSLALISATGMIVPFVGGLLLAIALFPHFAPEDVEFSEFSPFMGVALAVTAFPVLARILQDRGLTRTELGQTALGCAAIGDAAAWCGLAAVSGWIQAQARAPALMLAGSVVFIAVMILLVRPALQRFAHRPNMLVCVIAGAMLSAYATELIGLHALFGAFLFGALIPHESAVGKSAVEVLQLPVAVVLMPAFFAFSGLRTEIGLLTNLDAWLWCGAIIVVASFGKFGGTFLAAKWTGHDMRFSAALGALMNTRGLMELIILNVGLELGVISPTLFTMMVLMALVTTLATPPLLAMLAPPK